MSNTAELEDETYQVGCYNCRNTMDAWEAVWCTCLTSERSLVCPSCMKCFCKASKEYKDKFWTEAPQWMWDRKVAEEKELVIKPNEAPEVVTRPLVLIVDDDPMIQVTAARAIEKFGYGTIAALDGMEGLALARRYKPNLILSDILMPKMEGTRLCRFIKEDPEMTGIKFVVMTSLFAKAKYKTEVNREFQPDETLNKPLDFQHLWEVLKRHIR